jgi:hypothetical protein
VLSANARGDLTTRIFCRHRRQTNIQLVYSCRHFSAPRCTFQRDPKLNVVDSPSSRNAPPVTDAQRRRLTAAAKKLGHKALRQLDTLVTPDTWLRQYRRLVAA